jgi:ribosomal protein S18 acetylase RimI-like enzyme
MPFTIQLASADDLEEVLPLMRQMQADDPWAEPYDESTARKNLHQLFLNPHFGLIYIVRENQISIAYLVICFDFSLEYRGKGAWIDELFVQPRYRGQGIGTQLLELAERASKQHGAQFLHLEVNHGNRAIKLYRRRGFTDHNRYLMTKPL